MTLDQLLKRREELIKIRTQAQLDFAASDGAVQLIEVLIQEEQKIPDATNVSEAAKE